MILKLIGAGLLIICGLSLGLGRLSVLRRQISLLEALDSSLAIIEGEIALCCRPLPDIFEALGRDGVRETAGLFGELAENCEHLSAGEAWSQCFGKLELPHEALRALLSIGPVLGVYDGEKQRAEIAYVRERLEIAEEALKEEIASKGKSYPTLGASLAGIVAMLMI